VALSCRLFPFVGRGLRSLLDFPRSLELLELRGDSSGLVALSCRLFPFVGWGLCPLLDFPRSLESLKGLRDLGLVRFRPLLGILGSLELLEIPDPLRFDFLSVADSTGKLFVEVGFDFDSPLSSESLFET